MQTQNARLPYFITTACINLSKVPCYLDRNYTTMAGKWKGLTYTGSCNPQHCYHTCRSHIQSKSSHQHYSWKGVLEILILPLPQWWSSSDTLAPVDCIEAPVIPMIPTSTTHYVFCWNSTLTLCETNVFCCLNITLCFHCSCPSMQKIYMNSSSIRSVSLFTVTQYWWLGSHRDACFMNEIIVITYVDIWFYCAAQIIKVFGMISLYS
jgi:hypothetical protein